MRLDPLLEDQDDGRLDELLRLDALEREESDARLDVGALDTPRIASGCICGPWFRRLHGSLAF